MSSDQPGNGTGSAVPAQTQQQESPLIGGLDPMTLSTMSMGTAPSSNSAPRQATPSFNPIMTTTVGSLLESLAPKFPPQNFDVPDISFSNSVSPNMDFDQSLFTSVHAMTGTAPAIYAQDAGAGATSGCMAATQPMTTSQQQMEMGGGLVATAMTSSHPMSSDQAAMMTSPTNRPLTSFLPTVSRRSPTGTSSSDDSDDLPLAQIAMKRAAGVAVSSPGLTATMASSVAATCGATNNSTASNQPDQPDSTPLEGSPPAGKKAKASKRKKKKDPNEPQKPVSAYALFFRDTQATIKGHNPSASFGEVSKIVASMWDQLDPTHKDVYKKKTEAAKKLYLKQLAAYRASQVSQSAADESDKSPSPPGIRMAPPGMAASSGGMMQNPGMIHPVTTAGPVGSIMQTHMPVSVNGPMMHLPPQVMQQQQQQQQQQQFMHQQQQQQQQHQFQMHHHHHHHHQQQQNMSPSPPSSMQSQPQQQHSSPHQHVHLQAAPPSQEPQQVPVYNSPPQSNNANSYHHQTSVQADHSTTMRFHNQNMDRDMAPGYNRCTRMGCSNQIIENPAWDSDYCSNECVITHCRDVFSSWSAARSGSNAFPVVK